MTKVRAQQMTVVPQANNSCPYKKNERDTDVVRTHVRTEAETGGTPHEPKKAKTTGNTSS